MEGTLQVELYEIELVSAVLRKEKWALKHLYEENYQTLFPVCRRYCPNQEDAEDVLHEGFLKIYRNIKSYKPGTSIEAWMKRIMVNTAIDHLRKQTRKRTEPLSTNLRLSAARPSPLSKITVDEILEALNHLSPTYRAIFNLFVIDGFSHAEIAKKLGIAESTSRSNLVKARKKLRKVLMPKYQFYG